MDIFGRLREGLAERLGTDSSGNEEQHRREPESEDSGDDGLDPEDLPENSIGENRIVEEEPEEIPLHDSLYYDGDDILMELEPGYHLKSMNPDLGETVEVIGARPYSGLDGLLVRYLTDERKIQEANPAHFRVADEELQELVGEAYGGTIDGEQEPASLRDDKYTPDLADGIAWLEGDGQAEKREPLSTLYSTKDTRELLLERVALPGDEGEILEEFLDEAWLKYAEDLGIEPEEGGVYRDRDIAGETYRVEAEHLDFPVRFEVEETGSGYEFEAVDSRLSASEEMVFGNVVERFVDIAGHYELEGEDGEYEVIRTA
jgi:hypothetical protein